MSLWICPECSRLQGFKESMSCFWCDVPLRLATFDLPAPAAALVERAKPPFTRWLPFTHNDEFRGMVEDPEGQWYRADDVDAVIAPSPAGVERAALRNALEVSIAEWRAAASTTYNVDDAVIYERCASQLEALLLAFPSGGEKKDPQS